MRLRALVGNVAVLAAAAAGISLAQTASLGGGAPTVLLPDTTQIVPADDTTGMAHPLTGAAQSVPSVAPQIDAVVVYLDEPSIVRLAAPAASIILGNRAVAEIDALDAQTLLITGMAYGRTSMTIFDADGELIADTDIIVQAPEGRVTVYRGTDRSTYVCYVYCQGAPIPGDEASFFETLIAQTGMRASIARGE